MDPLERSTARGGGGLPRRTSQLVGLKSRPSIKLVNHSRERTAPPSVITSKPANGIGRRELRMFYPTASCGGKSVLVRQLRGPLLSTWPWCSKRSSMALTAVASPSSLPQSSTGRFNAESGFMQSPDSNPAILNQVEGFPLRITGEAFSMAIN
jgi:hypothetical protein